MNRWGIIGCGRIAGRMAELLTDMPDVRITAAAARDISRAAAFAEKWGIPKAYGSYAELAADPEVDMVYAATIHPTHKEAVQQPPCRKSGSLRKTDDHDRAGSS